MATRLQIRDRARVRADQDGSTFPTDAQYNDIIDSAAKEVWYALIQSGWPISFTAKTAALSLSFMPLATGFFVTDTVAFIRGVYAIVGGTYIPLKRINEGDRASLMSSTGASYPTHYDIRIDASAGIGVEFLPYVAGTQVRVEYVAEYPGFVNDASVWPGPARSDELVVLRAAAAGMRKEGNDQGAAQLDREYAQLLEQVQNMASWVDMRNPATITNVNSGFSIARMPFDYEV